MQIFAHKFNIVRCMALQSRSAGCMCTVATLRALSENSRVKQDVKLIRCRFQSHVYTEVTICPCASRLPTVFGISNKECYGNETAGYTYMTGLISDKCVAGLGHTKALSVFASGDIPQGETVRRLLYVEGCSVAQW